MSFINVAVMLLVLLLAMIASMLYYGSRGKKQIYQSLVAVAERMSGSVTQKNFMHYSHLKSEVDGTPVELFFHLSEGHRKTSDFIYLVLSTPVKLPTSTIAVAEGVFAKTEDKGNFNDVAGDYLADLWDGRYVYADDDAASRHLLASGAVQTAMAPLYRYANIVLGPDAVTVGKPYGGKLDLAVDRIEADLTALVAAARVAEQQAAAPVAPATDAVEVQTATA